jgi:hypothetical protein
MPSFEPKFLDELKAALAAEGHADLAAQVDQLRVHEFVEARRPTSQFIYVVPKASLPEGELSPIILSGVAGLLCLLLSRGRIAVVETLSRDVLVRPNA